MKKILLAIIAVLLCANSRADDIALYKQNLTVTRTGAGVVSKTKYSGWMVLSLDASETTFAFVRADKLRLRFTVDAPESFFIAKVDAPKGKSLQALAVYDSDLSGVRAKGGNSVHDLFVNQLWTIPNSFAVSGADVFTLLNGNNYLDEYKGSLAYDKANTQTVNLHNYTFAETIEVLRQYYTDLGYIEE